MPDEVFSWGTVDDTPATPIQPEVPLEQRAQEPPKTPTAPAAQPPVSSKSAADEPKPVTSSAASDTPPAQEPPKSPAEAPKEESKPGDTKPEDKPKENESAPEVDSEDPVATAVAFYGQAGQLLAAEGLVSDEELNIDWAAAGIEDPLSPEGLAYRDKRRDTITMQKIDEYMRTKNPKGYAYYLHSDARLPDEDFFKSTASVLPEYELFKGNVDLHKQVLTDGYRSKGVPEAAINVIIDQAVKDGTLFTLSDAEYKAQQKAITDQLADLERRTKADEELFTQSLNKIENSIDDIILKDKTPSLVIPPDKKSEFSGYVKSLMGYNDQTKEFMFTHKIADQTKLPQILEALYFQFVNGNLNNLVRRQAATQVARKLGQKVIAAKTSGQGGKETGKEEEFIPISAIN